MAERMDLVAGPGSIEYEYYGNATGGWHGQVQHESVLYTVKAVGTGMADYIIGTDGDEQILLGGGDDVVKANGGVNWVDGGDGIDTLIDDHAWHEFEIAYDANNDRYYMALRASGDDPSIHLLTKMEMFQLDGELFDAYNILNVAPIRSELISGALHLEGVIHAGQEVARLGAVDDNAFDVFSWTLHTDSLEHYYLDGNIVRAAHDIDLDFEHYIDMLGGIPIMDLINGVSQQTWWHHINAFMDSVYVIKAIVADSYGATAFTNLVLSIGNVNESPQNIRLVGEDLVPHEDELSISENIAIGTRIATARGNDPEGDTLTWSLLDNGDGRFAIDASTGEITVAGVLDFENRDLYELTLRADDGYGGITDKTVSIYLLDQNEAPTGFSVQLNGFDAHAPAGTVVATLGGVIDPDVGDTHHWALSGEGSDRFEVVGNQVLLKAGVPVTAPVTIQVRAVDAGGLSVSKQLDIVANANAPVTGARFKQGVSGQASDGGHIDEGIVLSGTAIATLRALDGNVYDQWQWRIGSMSQDKYEVDANGVIRARQNIVLDYEDMQMWTWGMGLDGWDQGVIWNEWSIDQWMMLEQGYAIEIEVKDAASSSWTYQTLFLDIQDVNEAPSGIWIMDIHAPNRGYAGVQTVGRLVAVDEAYDTHVWQVVGDTSGQFSIDTNGNLRSSGLLTQTSYAVQVKVTDFVGYSYTETLILETSEPNSHLHTGFDYTPYLEHWRVDYTGVNLAQMGAVHDLDVGDHYRFEVVGEYADLFEIPQGWNALILKEGVTPGVGTYDVAIDVIDQHGNRMAQPQIVTIVLEERMPITDILWSEGGSVDEHSVGGTVIGWLDAVDGNATDYHTFTNADAYTSIFNVRYDGLVTLKAGKTLDYAQAPTHVLRVNAYDGSGNSCFKEMIVEVNDLIEDTNGTSGNDIMIGTPYKDGLYGLAGNDQIWGMEGNDILDGGSGRDVIHDGLGSDVMLGGDGVDQLHLDTPEDGDIDYVDGGSAKDTLYMGEFTGQTKFVLDVAGAEVMRGHVAASGIANPVGHGMGIERAGATAFVQRVETLVAGSGENIIEIGTYQNIINSGVTAFDFTVGSDDKGVFLSAVTAAMSGAAGVSRLGVGGSVEAYFLGVEEWVLSIGNDTITIDKTHVGTQGVTIVSNGGRDTLKFNNWTTGLVLGLDGLIEGTGVTVIGFTNFEGTSGDDIFYGVDGKNQTLVGRGGYDIFFGSLGVDTMISTGTLGGMLLDYSSSLSGVKIAYTGGFVKKYTGTGDDLSQAAGDTFSVVGRLDLVGSIYKDTMTISGNGGSITSNGGDDTMIGSNFSDSLIGADGYAEIIRPGSGNDFIDFGTGGGTLDFRDSLVAGVIDMRVGEIFWGDGSVATFQGELTRLFGSNKNDTIYGAAGNDVIDGGGGNDVVFGYDGNDEISINKGTVYGGAGDDTITIGEGAAAYGGAGNDIIAAGANSFLYGGNGDDILQSTGLHVTFVGGKGADTITLINPYYTGSVVSYADSDAGVTLMQGRGLVSGIGGDAEGDVIKGNLSFIGSDYDDWFELRMSQSSNVYAGDGNDTIKLLSGELVTVDGGDGNDTIFLSSRRQTANGGNGDDVFYGHGTMNGGDGDDVFYLEYGEYSIDMGGFTTTKLGGSVDGGSGNNTIYMGRGRDTLRAEEGSNTLIVSERGEDDKIYGFGTDDKIIFSQIDFLRDIEDLEGMATQVGNNVLIDFGYSSDYPELYGSYTVWDLGSITFMNTDMVALFATGDFLFS